MNLSPLLLLAGLGPVVAEAADKALPPGVQALEELKNGASPKNAVQNRFFLKSRRFELTPMIGFIGGNSFASRYTASVALGYHFSEQLMLEAFVGFSPDLDRADVSGLVSVLIDRAERDPDFTQPFDKTMLDATLGVRWSPVYGKINILGETVVNFDFFVSVGLGFVLQNEWTASYNPDHEDDNSLPFFLTQKGATETRLAPNIGFGVNFFLSQLVALRLDGRLMMIVDDIPDYRPDDEITFDGQLRVVPEVNAAVGVAFFFPKMKPRLYDF